jgi:hypothetical protein
MAIKLRNSRLFETNKINNGLMQHGSKNVQSLLEEEV